MSKYPTLKDFIKNRRLFVAVEPNKLETMLWSDFIITNSLFNGLTHSGRTVKSPAELNIHSTIWYSKTGHINPSLNDIGNIACETDGWELLGENKEHLTIRLKPNETLMKIRDEYGKYGLTDPWPKFKPHVTVCYHYNKKIPRIQPHKFINFNTLRIEETIDVDTY